MCFMGDGGAGKRAKEQRADEIARQNRIKQGMGSIDQAFSGFNDAFFDKRKQDYVDYAKPQLERQADDARKALIFALARTGNLDSSASIEQNSDLNYDLDKGRIDIANKGLDLANQTRADVENTRSGVVSQLNATGDSSAAAEAALRASANLNMPQGYSPLGEAFASFLSNVAKIGSNANNNYGGFVGSGKPLFAASNGSQRVVG